LTKVHRTLVRGDTRLSVTDWGGDGPPMVFIHGLNGKQRDWDPVATQLAEQCRVITYDQRCHGSSSWSADHSWPTFVADLAALLNDLELHDVTLVGHSIGAGIALQVAVGNQACRALALLDGAFPVPEPAPPRRPVYAFLGRLVRSSMRTMRGSSDPGHALSSSDVRKVGNDYRSRYAEFDMALRGLQCPTTLILGSALEPGPEGPAFQVSRQGAAAHASASNPRIHVQWIEARHDMVQTQPDAIRDALVRLLDLA
jgi:pimeloyl-ACP methyl ester carboxylesterase